MSTIQLQILENRKVFYSSLDVMDQMVYIEVLVMHRIRDSFAMNMIEDCTLFYDSNIVKLDYENDRVMVEYVINNYEFIKEYQYDFNYNYLIVNTVD